MSHPTDNVGTSGSGPLTYIKQSRNRSRLPGAGDTNSRSAARGIGLRRAAECPSGQGLQEQFSSTLDFTELLSMLRLLI
jgi:hypothetical protein